MSRDAPRPPASPPWGAGRRVLILIAHPDDEVVGCCAAIGRARAAGAELHGLVLTTGVPAREVLWPWDRRSHPARVARRREECRTVARLLGFSGLEFLEVPARRLRAALLDVHGRLLQTLSRLAVDVIWAPAYEGGHADHDNANALAASLLAGNGKRAIAAYEYAEYNLSGGAIRSQTFPKLLGTEFVLDLSADEVRLKRQALAGYRSAQGDLGYVRVERESFRPLVAYDYDLPPHPGKLFYQRFQWVFFRHPRVDFTSPEEVCRDLAAFRHSP